MCFVMFQVCQTRTNKQKSKGKSNGHGLHPSYLQLSPLSVEPGKAEQKTGHVSATLICLLQHLIRGDQALDKAGEFWHSNRLWFLFSLLF